MTSPCCSTGDHRKPSSRGHLLLTCALLLLAHATTAEPEPPAASHDKLPRWRGFNLTEKFYKGREAGPFKEEDFRMISGWGFNFVRLPMDYRFWIKHGDWRWIDEDALTDIDQAIEWGRQYGVHVCLNFHRAPGYTVAKPPEEKDLWTDPDAQEVCAMHWATFARRYKGIPSSQLSFNLLNEPQKIDPQTHYRVIKILVDAIRRADPNRLIIADGREFGKVPCPELVPLKIAQATRGYQPHPLTHYKASWTGGEKFPKPTWPLVTIPGTLFAPSRREYRAPFRLKCHNIRLAAGFRIHVDVVSIKSRLVVKADGVTILDEKLPCGPGEGPWKKVVYNKQWHCYQNVYDRDYQATIPGGTEEITIGNEAGDWLSFTELEITCSQDGVTRSHCIQASGGWEEKQGLVVYDANKVERPFDAYACKDSDWLWLEYVLPWHELSRQGVGAIVGEFGAYNKTPHDVTLRWMEDCLQNWQSASMGWALWNLRGSFGILDSGRTDVDYEEYEGHQLDRKMLELLQKY